MRSCIYCGKELEKGEVCDCPQSVAHRAAKEQRNNTYKSTSENEYRSNADNSSNSYNKTYNSTSYRTGYTKKESKAKQAWDRHKMKRFVHRSSKNTKGFFRNLIELIRKFILSPVESVINPQNISKITILTISAIQGAVIWLCIYFIMSNVRRGPFALLASLLAFNGTSGYINIVNMLMAILSGAVSGIILFFIYSGIFYAINRFIFRLNTRYWDFSQRLSLTCIPTTVLGIIGALCSVFSSTTLMIFMLCGAVSWVVLTYEALRTEWISKTPGKTMYAMMLGFFVFFSIICYLIRLA